MSYSDKLLSCVLLNVHILGFWAVNELNSSFLKLFSVFTKIVKKTFPVTAIHCLHFSVSFDVDTLLSSVFWYWWLSGPLTNWVIRCWCGYLSGAKCKWFAYDPANATATPSSIALLKFRMVLPFWHQLTQVVLEKRPWYSYSTSLPFIQLSVSW